MENRTLLDKPPDYEKVSLGKEFLSMYIFLTQTTKYREYMSALISGSIERKTNQDVVLKNKKEIADTVDLIMEYITIKQQHEKILSRYINIDDIESELNQNNKKPDIKHTVPLIKNRIKPKIIDKENVDEKMPVYNEVIDELKKIDEELRASIFSNENGVRLNENDSDAITICANCGKQVPKTMLCLYCGSPILFHIP